jgi:hypothetical protein
MKAAPSADSYIRALEKVPEKKMKNNRSLERKSDSGVPSGIMLPQAFVRLSVHDPSTAPAMIREAVFRSGGSITKDHVPPFRHIEVHIPGQRQNELMENLQRLGRVTERPVSPPGGTQELEVTIQW